MKNFTSIIIPVFNEEGNLAPLAAAIAAAMGGVPHEVLFVDDGSSDGSPAELARIAQGDKRVHVMTLKRNFGQTAALAAGIDHARGDVIVPMDADGQNDPADIPRLLEKLDEGVDVVSGWRRVRNDRLLSRRLPSWIANALISFATGVRLHDYGCTLKAYRKEVIGTVQLAGEMHRFLPAWCVWQGGRVSEIEVRHHPRTRGESKYGISRTFKVLIDLLTLKFFSGYLFKPNYLFTGIGMVFVALSAVAVGIAVVDKVFFDAVPQFRIPLMLLSVFLGLVAVFVTLMGLLAELLVRLYFQVRNQKPYRLINE